MKHILRFFALLALVPALLHAQAQPSFTVGGYSFLGNGNFAVGVTTGGVLVPIQVLADGTVVTSGGGGGGGGTSSTFGATFPTSGTAAGIKDSTGLLMSFAKVNASNALTVDGSAVTQPVSIAATITANAIQSGAWVVSGTGTAGTPASGVMSVQGISGGTPLSAIVNDGTASGSITTQNLNPNSGTATAGSTVAITGLNSGGTLVVGVQGSYTGALSVQVTADGSNWVTLPQVENLSTAAVTANIASGSTGVWQASLGTINAARVTALAAVTGTATVTVRAGINDIGETIETALPAGTNTIGAVTGAGTAGTPSGGVLSIQGVSSGTVVPTQEARLPSALGQQAAANSLGVALANEDVQDQYFTGQSAQTATVNNIIPATSGSSATDATGYQSGSIEVDSTGTAGTYILEGSNSNVNFVTVPMFNITVYTGTPITGAVTASAANILYTFPIQYRYIRLRIASTITGGSIQAFTALKKSAFSSASTLVANATTANLLTNSNLVTVGGTAVVTGGVAGIQAIAGNIADGSAQTANPVEVAGYTVTTVPAAALGNSLTKRMPITSDYQVIVHQDGDPSNEFQATSGTTPLASTSSTQLVAAAGSGIRHYVTGIQVANNSTTGGTCSILDGGTVIWTGYLPATGTSLQEVPVTVEFRTPLKGTAATALNIQLSSASMSVYYNVQGFNAN